MRPGEIVIDRPVGWDRVPIPFPVVLKGSDGFWLASGTGWAFRAVRADTPEAIVLTGRITGTPDGNGPFIIVIPKPEPVE